MQCFTGGIIMCLTAFPQLKLTEIQIQDLKKRARAIAYFEDKDYDISQLLTDIVTDAMKLLKPYKFVKPESQITPKLETSQSDSPIELNINGNCPSIEEIKGESRFDGDEHFRLNLGRDLDKFIKVLKGKCKTATFDGEPARITSPSGSAVVPNEHRLFKKKKHRKSKASKKK